MVRGKSTGPAVVPTAWRGPMPDASVRRELATEGGYAKVPERVLLSGLPDLGVMTWVLLRLWADDGWVPATYRTFADHLGMRDLPTKAAEKRFVRVIPAMIEAELIERRRDADNQVHYRARLPPGGRFAILRRSYDLPLLQSGVLHPRTGKLMPVTVSHLVDFARWQLEAGRRGWTTASAATLATRWGVSKRTLEMRRDSLTATGLLQVVRRSGYPDLVWIGELHDPHWLVPTEPLAPPGAADQQPRGRVAGSGNLPPGTRAGSGKLGLAGSGNLPPTQDVGTPYKEHLDEVLKVLAEEDPLADLGGASATPLSSVTRELGDAEPQAAPRSTTGSRVDEPGGGLLASRLLASQPRLVAADRRWRSGMLASIGRALERGLDAAHLARALQRVVEAGEVEMHCEIVRAAVRQAWADQRAGGCAECGADPGQHLIGCPHRAAEAEAAGEDEAEIRQLIIASLDAAQLTADGARPVEQRPLQRPAVAPRLDPLQPYLELKVPLKPDAAPEVAAEWLSSRIAGRLVDLDVEDVQGRRRALDRSVAWWACQLPAHQQQALDLAATQLHFALSSPARRAS